MASGAMQAMRVGLLGMGTVGRGTWDVLRRNGEEIARRAGRPITINRNPPRPPSRAHEAIGASQGVEVGTDLAATATHPDVDIVVELIGGVEPAKTRGPAGIV